MKTLNILLLALFFGSLLFISCNKDENTTNIKDNTVSEILDIADFYNTDDLEEATSSETEKSVSEVNSRCFDVIINENDNGEFWPRSWTLDFGDDYCENYFGIAKTGMVHINLTDCWRIEGSLRTITFENFYVENVLVEGVKTIENIGLNESNNMTWLRKMTDGKLTYEDSTSSTWESTRYSEMIEGTDTWAFADDVYLVTGFGNGVDKDNNNFSVEITTALKYIFGCRFPVSGVLEIIIEGAEPIIIDFGTGDCDNIATQTINGVTTEIELGK
ncbi:MAG: hypothetical protein JXR51_08810 [Bacteroidales bacterium]|nr:hypothetical protein [Bacteroidales bacterium]MBN2757264.1 hypothetical protein [Bacteroidales bacterium]